VILSVRESHGSSVETDAWTAFRDLASKLMQVPKGEIDEARETAASRAKGHAMTREIEHDAVEMAEIREATEQIERGEVFGREELEKRIAEQE
jgi:hypothetical protein